MITVKVSKKDWLVFNKGYLTNGEWLFDKDQLNTRKSSVDLVSMISLNDSFMHTTDGLYQLGNDLPDGRNLIPKKIDGYVLNKTDVLIDCKSFYARVYQIHKDNETLNVWLKEEYSKMFNEYKLVTSDFSNTGVIKIIKDDVIGVVMPVVSKNKNITV